MALSLYGQPLNNQDQTIPVRIKLSYAFSNQIYKSGLQSTFPAGIIHVSVRFGYQVSKERQLKASYIGKLVQISSPGGTVS